ncbi:MAG: GNAT family N-acetyltransferase [Parvularculaceae bacterium]
MEIRPERAGDEDAIRCLTRDAFAPMPFSDGSEAAIIDQLRDDGDLTLSLVSTDGDDVVGYVAFSPVSVNGVHGGWFGLGPVAVRPDRQRRGVGDGRIRGGLSRIRDLGAAGCALIGDPAYYSRFGFRSDGGLAYGDIPARYVQWLSLGAPAPKGTLAYAPAFDRAT